MAKITEQWLSERFETRYLDEGDTGAGVYYCKNLCSSEWEDLALVSGTKNGFLEVMLFPYENIRFQTTEQVEDIYKLIKRELLKRL